MVTQFLRLCRCVCVLVFVVFFILLVCTFFFLHPALPKVVSLFFFFFFETELVFKSVEMIYFQCVCIPPTHFPFANHQDKILSGLLGFLIW